MTLWLNPHRGPGNTLQEAGRELGGQGGKLPSQSWYTPNRDAVTYLCGCPWGTSEEQQQKSSCFGHCQDMKLYSFIDE